ncbi:MAG TPA: hypothetical protein VMB50_15095 [Myxococcales bacterium]|nr:hypothetical protein [Myxococcales bacterium]
MRPLAASLALAFAACAPFVRSDESSPDAGTPSFSVLDINGFLAPPGTPLSISNEPVATSPKFYLRASTGTAPTCWYGVFVADPSAAGQPNNGVLLSALGDMDKINSAFGQTRVGCPDPSTFAVGGGIPDGVQIGDRLTVDGFFEPYCDYYNTSLGQCQYDLFPEVTPDPPPNFSEGSIEDNGSGITLAPLVVDPTQISDLAAEAIQYAGELLQVQHVTVSDLPLDAYGDVVLDQGSLWLTSLGPAATIGSAPGTAYCSITGNLHFQFGHWKLRPRQQSDLVLCPTGSNGQCDYSLCPGS